MLLRGAWYMGGMNLKAACLLSLFGLSCLACNGHTRPPEPVPAVVSVRLANPLPRGYETDLRYSVEHEEANSNGLLFPRGTLGAGEARDFRDAIRSYVGAQISLSGTTWSGTTQRGGRNTFVLSSPANLCTVTLEDVPDDAPSLAMECRAE